MGSRNKAKAPRLAAFIEEHVNKKSFAMDLLRTINKVKDPKDRAKLMLDLMQYAVPKLKAIEVDHAVSEEAGKIVIAYSLEGQGQRKDPPATVVDVPTKDKELP